MRRKTVSRSELERLRREINPNEGTRYIVKWPDDPEPPGWDEANGARFELKWPEEDDPDMVVIEVEYVEMGKLDSTNRSETISDRT